jgi:hypothetical protein
MAGGGSGDQEKGFFFRMFSDFSSRQMKTYLEAELVVSHPKPGQGGGGYGRWDGATATYKPLVVDGVFLPTQDDVPVYTLVYSTSATTAEANFLYEPQGPHTSGLLRAFDPSQNEDRSQARETLCKGRCDFTLRVTQGGKTYLNMVPGKWNPASKATSLDSFQVGALNVPAHRGAVQNAKLLLTPNVAVDGLPSNPRVLYHYEP